jgi:hypothetical protein
MTLLRNHIQMLGILSKLIFIWCGRRQKDSRYASELSPKRPWTRRLVIQMSPNASERLARLSIDAFSGITGQRPFMPKIANCLIWCR